MKILRLMAPFVFGGLLPLGFAPFNFWWLSIISVGAFPLLLKQSKGTGFLRGWAYGTGVYCVGVSWVYVSLAEHTTAGPIPAALATTLLGICLGLFFGVLGFAHQRIPAQYRTPITSITLWVSFEWLRSWLFTGFPWLYLGYATLESSLFKHWIPVVGIYGCSFILGLWSILLIQELNHLRLHRKTLIALKQQSKHLSSYKPAWSSISFLMLIPLIHAGLSQAQWTKEIDETLKIALIQGNIAQEDKWNSSKTEMINNRYLQQTQFALDDNADLVVWPEAAVPHLYSLGKKVLEEARTLLQTAQQKPELISGILTDNQSTSTPATTTLEQQTALQEIAANQETNWKIIRNSVLKINNNPEQDQFYHKQNLVPFGEYLPFANVLVTVFPFLDAFKHGISKGPVNQPNFQIKGWSLQTLICYEIAFPELAFHQARQNHKDSEFYQSPQLIDAILTVSNDGWFGMSHGPAQHFEIARFRAKEFGRPVIRATNTGITGIIDANGEVVNQAPREKLAVVMHELKKNSGETPYSKIGPQLVLLTIVSIWLLSLLRPIRKTKRE